LLCELSAGNENGVFNNLMVLYSGSIVEASLHVAAHGTGRAEHRERGPG